MYIYVCVNVCVTFIFLFLVCTFFGGKYLSVFVCEKKQPNSRLESGASVNTELCLPGPLWEDVVAEYTLETFILITCQLIIISCFFIIDS